MGQPQKRFYNKKIPSLKLTIHQNLNFFHSFLFIVKGYGRPLCMSSQKKKVPFEALQPYTIYQHMFRWVSWESLDQISRQSIKLTYTYN